MKKNVDGPEDNVDKFSRERHEIEIYDYARVELESIFRILKI